MPLMLKTGFVAPDSHKDKLLLQWILVDYPLANYNPNSLTTLFTKDTMNVLMYIITKYIFCNSETFVFHVSSFNKIHRTNRNEYLIKSTVVHFIINVLLYFHWSIYFSIIQIISLFCLKLSKIFLSLSSLLHFFPPLRKLFPYIATYFTSSLPWNHYSEVPSPVRLALGILSDIWSS